jgi:hypothetical protein
MASVRHESKGVVMSATAARKHSRELATRQSQGLAVVLRWYPGEGAVTVSVDDAKTGDRFEIVVDRKRALDAFYHPYVYAA